MAVAGLLLLAIVAMRLSGSQDPTMYAAMMALCVMVPLVTKIVKGRFDIFEVDVVFLLIFALSYLWRAIALIRDPTDNPFAVFWRPEGLWFACYIVALGIASFNLGYSLPFGSVVGRSYPQLNAAFSVKRATIAFMGMLIVSVGAYAAHVVILGGAATYMWSLVFDRSHMYVGHGWLTPFQGLSLIAVPFGYVYLKRSGHYRPLMVLGSLVALAVLAMTLSRGVFLTWIVVIAVVRHYLIQKISVRTALVYGVLLISLSVALQTIREAPFGNARSSLRETIFNSVESTFSGFDTAVMVMDNYPEPNPFFHGKTIIEAYSYPWIPRAVWSGKPTIYGGTAITEPIGQFFMYGSHINSEIFGELYANFNVIGVVLGMVLQGVLARSIYVALVRTRTLNPGQILFYGYLIALLPGWQRIGAGSAVYHLLQFVVPILGVLAFVHAAQPRRVPAQHKQPTMPHKYATH